MILKARRRSDTLPGAVECDDTGALYVAGGVGGGPATIADGADVAQGATTDAEAAGNGSVIAILKRLRTLLAGGLPASLGQKLMAASLPVAIASDQSSLTVDQPTHDLLNANANMQVGDADVGAGNQVPVSVADGDDVAEGTTTDAAVVTDVAGTISGKLRGLVKWAFERMPASLGQGTMAQSLSVVLASNQTVMPVEAVAITTPTHTAVNVTAASGAVLAANANRLYALLVNDSDTVVYIKLGAAAVVNQGIRINAAGGNYEISSAFGNLYTGAIYGIHGGAGNKALLMTEGV